MGAAPEREAVSDILAPSAATWGVRFARGRSGARPGLRGVDFERYGPPAKVVVQERALLMGSGRVELAPDSVDFGRESRGMLQEFHRRAS